MPDAILTDGLTKWHGSKCVVNALSLRVPKGCVYGSLGRNGAGKSTTIKMLTGMVHPDDGTASLLGQDVATMPPEMRQRIAYLTEGYPLYSWMTIGGLMRFTWPFYPAWNQGLLDQIIEHFELDRKKKVKHLSK